MNVFDENSLVDLYYRNGVKHLEQHKKYLNMSRLSPDNLQIGRREEMLSMYTVAATIRSPEECWTSLLQRAFSDFKWSDPTNVIAVLEHSVAARKEIWDSLSNKAQKHILLDRRQAGQERARIEGASRYDVLVTDGTIRVYIESKLLSDIDLNTKYVMDRNQIARLIDVGFSAIGDQTNRFYFLLLTPRYFKSGPASRLYHFKMHQYMNDPDSLRKDVPRFDDFSSSQMQEISARIGWITWEDCLDVIETYGALTVAEFAAFKALYHDLNLASDKSPETEVNS